MQQRASPFFTYLTYIHYYIMLTQVWLVYSTLPDLKLTALQCFQSRDVQAVWTEDHALAWHLEEKFRQNSKVWALDKCLAWDQLEEKLPSFIRELTDCPCTLAQARADTGRFHVSDQGANTLEMSKAFITVVTAAATCPPQCMENVQGPLRNTTRVWPRHYQ